MHLLFVLNYYLLLGHVDAISKNQYLHMWMRIAVLRNADAVNNHICVLFIKLNSLKRCYFRFGKFMIFKLC
jgi:hypothetical protein